MSLIMVASVGLETTRCVQCVTMWFLRPQTSRHGQRGTGRERPGMWSGSKGSATVADRESHSHREPV